MGLGAEAVFASQGDFRAALGYRALRSQKISHMGPSVQGGDTPNPTKRTQQGCQGSTLWGGSYQCPLHCMKCRGFMGDLPFRDLPLGLFCPRYEEEVSLRATAENEFVALKKVRNVGSGSTDRRVSE